MDLPTLQNVRITNRLTIKNCLGRWFDSNESDRDAYAMIMDCFPRIPKQAQFRQMIHTQMHKLLSSEDLAIYSEIDVLNALIKWTSAKQRIRRAHFVDLVKLVRFDTKKPKVNSLRIDQKSSAVIQNSFNFAVIRRHV